MKKIYSLLLVLSLIAMPSMLYANVAIPTIALIVPFFWLAFIPVVFIEAAVMRRTFNQYSFKKLLFYNTASNAASTFVGVPLAYILLYIVSPIGVGLLPWGGENALSYTWQSMLFLGDGSRYIGLGVVLLFIFFFVISVFVERWVLSRMLEQDYNHQILTKEVIKANVASYLALPIFTCLIMMVGYLISLSK